MEHIDEWIESINAHEDPIVTEGKKDKVALENIGVKVRIFTLSRKPIYAVAEEAAEENDHVVILTDYDPEGKKLEEKLVEEFQRLGVRFDLKHKKMLKRLTRISHVEGVDTYYQKKMTKSR